MRIARDLFDSCRKPAFDVVLNTVQAEKKLFIYRVLPKVF